MNAMDAAQNYFQFRALKVEVPERLKWNFLQNARLTRELAVVNAHAEALWAEHRKKWTFGSFIQEYIVAP